jgi:hypothetical protein
VFSAGSRSFIFQNLSGSWLTLISPAYKNALDSSGDRFDYLAACVQLVTEAWLHLETVAACAQLLCAP